MATRRTPDTQRNKAAAPQPATDRAAAESESSNSVRQTAPTRRRGSASRPQSEQPAAQVGESRPAQPRQVDTSSPTPAPRIHVSPEARHAMIAESAYLRAERRGFYPGYELEDWLAAEKEIDTLLAAEHLASRQ